MTDVQLVNLALAKLGSSLIVRLGDETIPGSHFGGLLYKPTLKRVLRDHPWSFATEEQSLSQLPEPKLSGYNYSYSLPADFVRLGSLPKGNHRFLRNEDFKRTKQGLHTNESPALLRYVSSDIQPSDMDEDFREAVVVLLAAELAPPLIQNPDLGQSLKQEYLTVALPKAETSDAREGDSNENHGPYQAFQRSPLLQSRFRSTV